MVMATAETSNIAPIKITHLTHDLTKGKSIVSLSWADGSERRLGLAVPYGTSLNDIHQEAVNALRQLEAELSAISVGPIEKS
jgi:hypothetical protein